MNIGNYYGSSNVIIEALEKKVKMKKENFQVDGIGINAAHYEGYKESDFIKDVSLAVPDKFGDENAKKAWAKKAFDLMKKTFPQPGEK